MTLPTKLDNHPVKIEGPEENYRVLASPLGRGNLLVSGSDSYDPPGDCHGRGLAMTVVLLAVCSDLTVYEFLVRREGHDPPLQILFKIVRS